MLGQSTHLLPSKLTSHRKIVILFFHLVLVLPRGRFLATCPAHQITIIIIMNSLRTCTIKVMGIQQVSRPQHGCWKQLVYVSRSRRERKLGEESHWSYNYRLLVPIPDMAVDVIHVMKQPWDSVRRNLTQTVIPNSLFSFISFTWRFFCILCFSIKHLYLFTLITAISNSIEQSPWEPTSFSSSRNSSPFIEPEGSLQTSQEAFTLPCLEPNQFNLQSHNVFL
jgi:hypothetical protein